MRTLDNVHDSDEEQDDSSFRLRRARLKWDGYVHSNILNTRLSWRSSLKAPRRYTALTDGSDRAKAVELIDWWASYNKNPAFVCPVRAVEGAVEPSACNLFGKAAVD